MESLKEVNSAFAMQIPAIRSWLEQYSDLYIDHFDIKQYTGGYSNLTYRVTINDDVHWVLRKPPVGANIKSGHDMKREFTIISALYPHFPKVPKPIAFCDDHEVIGSEFYIMEKVDGWILRSGMSDEETPLRDQMGQIYLTFCDHFVGLHQLDYMEVGLGTLGNPENYPERQVHGWTKRYYNAKTDEVDSVESLAKWLGNHIPHLSGSCLIHNDFKYDNIILDETNNEVRAILDWEMSTIGDPLMDLGSSLGYWVNADDPPWLQAINLSPTTLPGNASRETLLHDYSTKSGKDPGNGVFYYAYGMFKLAVIAQQIFARYKAGLSKDPKFAHLDKVVRACGDMAMRSIERKKIDQLF
ncbi:MAG: phosphotransferase family protein [Saprospiraceae bacterium]